uniref:Uncharacterized protein n=1 Tax=Moniliophthora roreri TaxID=221103 RepID=A0A0W0FC36_MONRR
MKGRNSSLQESTYACKCLNVKLRCKPLDELPDLPTSPDYKPVYIDSDEDIKIVFPHLTLRTRKRAPYIPDPAKTARYTSLSCLCCQTLVYRVHRIVSVNDEHNLKEGPLITKGWTETEVLRSVSGWVEIFSEVLEQTDEAISKLENSSSFSPIFGIILAPSPQSPTSEPLSERTQEEITKYKLPPIAPIFPEPKSHTSLFAVLASLAGQRSANLRSQAEDYIDDVVKEKVEEIKRVETQLKRDVQFLLNKYNEGIKRAEQEQNAVPEQASISQERVNAQRSPESPIAASVIRDFVPMPVPVARRATGTSVAASTPRISSLSVSLATSSFHHPKARSQSQSPPQSPTPRSPMSLKSASSATLTIGPNHTDSGNVYRWSRNTDEHLDVATSYNYFLLEEEMERRKQDNARLSSTVPAFQQAGPSTTRAAAPSANTKQEDENQKRAGEQRPVNSEERPNSNTLTSPSPKSKGKRKVTFDVKVNQVEGEDDSARDVKVTDATDMLFDFEDEVAQKATSTQATLPLLEQPAFTRPQQPRKRGSGSLPEAFSSLRPSSLPAPSHISRQERFVNVEAPSNDAASPPEDQLPFDNSIPEFNNSIDLPIPEVVIPGLRPNGDATPTRIETSKEDQMLQKLAVSTPSHRAAWKANPEAFKAFLSNKNDDWVDGEPEEELGGNTEVMDQGGEMENDHWHNQGIPGSVPITINRSGAKPKPAPLSLASYRQEAFLSSGVNARNGRRRSSSVRLPTTYEGRHDEQG